MKSKFTKGFLLLKKMILNDSFKARIFYAIIKYYIKVDEKVILYEAYHGKSMTGNPYALFLNMIDDIRFQDSLHIWILENPEIVTQKQQANVRLLKRNSLLHMYYLLKSKYLINNTTFLPHVNIKENQIYINTWHGTPLKTLGKDVKFNYGNARNVLKNLLQTDFFISPNQYTTEVFFESNDVDTIYSGKIIESGYPRNDLLFLDDIKRKNLFLELGLKSRKKVLLYAPTFRGSHIDVQSSNTTFVNFIKLLEEKFGEEYNILTKLHPIDYSDDLDIKMVPENLDTNEVLGIVDVLITDYSSVAFDFLVLKRPIIYFVFDLDEYIRDRGIYIDIYDMPGVVCKNEENVLYELSTITSFMDTHKEKYVNAIEKFCRYDDGFASQRIIDSIFFKNSDNVNIYQIKDNNKKKVLIYGGSFLNNGVTSSLLALLANISYDEFDIYLISTINVSSSDFLRTIQRVRNEVKIIYISESGTKLFQSLYKIMSFEKLEKLFKEENYTFFGNTKFDVAIDYSGYGIYWACMIAFSNATKKNIYLHSDMKQESKLRPEIFDFNFMYKLYKNQYDKLITVSDASLLANKETFFDLKDKFMQVDNLIDAKSIISLSQEKNAITIDKSKINFINIARYSVEKGQDRLIDAFYELLKINKNVHLYLVGYGVLYKNLESQIIRLGIQSHITMTGNMDNPFPLLKESDCFVLSSHYEGQGLVLLESMVLNIPCISTNIAGPQSLLSGGNGLLVENSTKGILQGMMAFLEGKVQKQIFNYEEYIDNSLNSFYKTIR